MLLSAAGTLLAGLASAAEPERGAITSCAPDLAKFCPGIEAGGGKKMRCLMDNRAGLSADCAGAVSARQAQRAGGAVIAQAPSQLPGQAPAAAPPAAAPPVTGQPPGTMAPPAAAPAAASLPKASPVRANMRACRTDTATFCGAVERGGGRKVKCLMDNQAKLSPDCASAISSVQSQKQASKSACEADIATLCPAARGPARRQCLDANKPQLSAGCANLLAARAAKQGTRAAIAPPKQ
jgi:hypothetical protein